MDMLFEEISHEKKIRLHFHRFMQNLHESLKQHEGTDPLKKIVKDLSKKYECLCFDEFYVEDIADAMLLGNCLLYTSPSPRDLSTSRMPSSA